MEWLNDLTLVSETFTQDDIGQQIATETTRTIFCTVHSVTRREWADASQKGLKPEFMCFLRDSGDYNGEMIAELDGARYIIYRTYLTDDGGVELYMRKDAGAVA